MAREGRQTGRRGRLTWVGGSVAVAAVLQFLPGMLGTFELQKYVAAAISVLIFLVGLLVGHHSARRAQAAEARERAAALCDALLRWPPPDLSDVSAHDLGVRGSPSGGGAAYIARDRDVDMDTALRQGIMLVVFGPAGSGKSRSALEAAKRWSARGPQAAVVLAPRDADGLELLIGERREDVLGPGTRGLLWLDGLERYLDTLSLDRLRTFVAGEDRPTATDRMRAAAARLTRGAAAPARTPSVALVATIRDDELEKLLAGSSVEGLVLRQLLGRGAGVPLAGQLSPSELRAFETQHGAPAPVPAVGAAFSTIWEGGWTGEPDATPAAAERSAGFDTVGWLLVAATLGCCAVLLFLGGYYGWRIAPSLATQAQSLTARHAACQRAEAHPSKGAGLARTGNPDDGVLLTIVSGHDCPRSDEAGLYRLGTDGRLHDLAALRPALGARRTFSCIGPSQADPCQRHRCAGTRRMSLARSGTRTSGRELPVLLTMHEDGVALDVLAPRGDDVPLGFDERVQAAACEGWARRRGVGSAQAASGIPSAFEASPATVAAVAPETGSHPALVLLAYDDGNAELALPHVAARRSTATRRSSREDCLAVREGRVQQMRVKALSDAKVRAAMQTRRRGRASSAERAGQACRGLPGMRRSRAARPGRCGCAR